jgi:DNA helicase-2/ATP-dependent DNA helicase PcrA
MPDTTQTSSLLDQLNPAQREAAAHFEGPALVVAGAGSGKTRTVVHRIGHLMEAHGVYPTEILAVTFTNKAAGEMKSRVMDLVGPQADQLWVSTFHSAGVRILRVYGEFVGLKSGFVIYDDSDQLDVIKTILESIPGANDTNPRYLRSVIDRAKSNLWTPEDLAREGEDWMAGMPRELAVEGFKRYQGAMRRANAIDFGDLLVLVVQLFQDHPEVLDKVQQRAVFIHVDEYQDTNKAQYEFARLLSEKYRNLLVVGDPDQCLPAGTRILTPRGCVPIENICEGDEVLGTGAAGKPVASRVTHVKHGHYTGRMVTVCAASRVLRGTPHHIVPARMVLERDLHYVYLMYRADRGYRVGLTKSVRSNDTGFEDFGFRVRMNQEHADKLWILRVCASRAEAAYWEAYFAAKYNLPTQLFHGVGRGLAMDDAWLERLFNELDTTSAAQRLMRDRELHPEFPHYRPQNGSRRQSLNLIMFQDFRNGPVGYHRIQWSSNREDTAKKLLDAGFPVRGNGHGRSGYRIEMSRRDYPEALELARQIAQMGGMEIQRRAQIDGQMYAFTPLSHLLPGMNVLIEQAGTLEEARVDSVDFDESDEPVFDLEVAPTHTYIAEGMLVHNSIYRFRGADIQNILDFQHDYRDAVIYRLEENYRSNARILSVANKVIEQNTERLEKILRPIKPDGEPVRLYRAPDHRAEADFVANRIEHLRGTGTSLEKIAVLYRTNAQSRTLEERFLRSQIAVRIVGGVSFYERQEIKDMLSLARLAINPDDDVSLKRAIKRPKRGIGDSSVARLEEWARANRVSLFTAFGRADEILERGGKNAQEFHKLMTELGEYASEHTAEEFLKLAMDASGYVDMLKAELKTGSKSEAEARLENLNELVNAASEWDGENHGTIESYLDDAALLSSVDDARTRRNNKDVPEEAVTFMTMHNAKGLEFEDVFIVGLEEGLLPHRSSIVEPGGIEEERRLFYVGITRAMERLTMTLADSRQVYGKTMPSEKSRFLEDIPPDLIVPVNLFNQPLESEGTRSHGLEPARQDAHRIAPHIQAELERAGGVVTALKGGEKVKHPKFGVGKVLGVTGAGDRQEAMIMFEGGVGTKKLLVKYANLVFAT